jgi:hypothetical protein
MNRKHSAIVRRCVLSSVAAFAAMSALADAITWEGSTNLVLTAATTVEVPAGRTSRVDKLSGAYALTKTGGGVLEIRWAASAGGSIVISEGTVHFTNPRPDAIFAQATFHVDASDASSMTIVTENGTNFVTRWNDTDGGPRYATPSADTMYGRVPGRLPFIGQGTQNGLPYVDFGSLLSRGYTNENGVAIGYGAALIWNSHVNYKEGFTVVSDTPDIATLPATYPASSSWYAMSFFSRHDGVSGYRGQFYDEHLPFIYKDNSQNDAVTKNGASNWVDSAYISSPRSSYGFPSGFHVLNCSTPAGGRANAFGKAYNTSNYTSFGGTRIAEYAVFTNQLSAVERSEMTAYLRAKWFPAKLASVTIEEGASFAADEDVRVSAPITDNGALDIALGSQTAVFDKGLSKLGAFIHVDASQTNTMTLVMANGTNFITRWNDVDGGSMYFLSDTSTGSFGQRTEPSKRRPFLNPAKYQNGLPVADLGSAIYVGYTNSEGVAIGYGGAFKFYTLAEKYAAQVREYISVISDTEDLKTAPTGKEGPAYLAFYSGNTFNGQNPGRRGTTVSGKNPALLRKSDNTVCVNGGIYVNGEAKTYAYNPPDGFSVINLRPTSAVTCNMIGRSLRHNSSGQAADTYGGQRIAEYMLFTSVLDDAKRQRIYNALRNKWFGDVPATTNFYNLLSLGAEASMTVKYEAVAVTNALSLAGTLASPAVSVANFAVASTGAAVDGALTLADGATLSFTRLSDDTWTSLSATSVAAEGTVTVSLSGSLKGLGGKSVRLIATDNPPASLAGWTLEFDSNATTARLVLKDDGIWAEFLSPGLVIFMK